MTETERRKRTNELSRLRRQRFLERQEALGRRQKVIIVTEDEFEQVKAFLKEIRGEEGSDE